MKRSASVSYKEGLLERLKDPEYSVAYLNACLEDEDPQVFLLALKDVIEAHGGMRKAAIKAELSRESIKHFQVKEILAYPLLQEY